MRKTIALLLILVIFKYLPAAKRQDSTALFLPGQIIVKLASGSTDIAYIHSLASRISLAKGVDKAIKPLINVDNLKAPERARRIGLDRIYTVLVDVPGDLKNYCEQLQQDPAVEWAEPGRLLPIQTVPNDPYYSKQYHLPQIMAPEAWDIVKGNSSVVIGIIDTGVDFHHEDLTENIWINPGEDINFDGLITSVDSNGVDDDNNGYVDDFVGWDWVTGVSGPADADASPLEDGEKPDNDPSDVNGHGTHCAGLAAATTNNSIGVSGVSWGCSIMPLRIGYLSNDGNGYGSSIWMAKAFIYAADNGADVVNLSYSTSWVVTEGARYAFENGVAIATSAGNENTTISGSLQSQPWVLTVTAVDAEDVKTYYSNFGQNANIAAPGGVPTILNPGLWSTYPNNNYRLMQGTSMASPIIAGALGLLKSRYPDWTVPNLLYQLVGTADNIDDVNPEYTGLLGDRVNVYRSVTETAAIPKPELYLKKIELVDTDGNNNGLADPGETIYVLFHLQNNWGPTGNVTFTLHAGPDEDRLTINTACMTLDSIYGIEQSDKIYTNSSNPFEITMKSSLLPTMIPMYITAENAVISDTFKFQISVHPLVLFVDDHLGGGDGTDMPIRDYYDELFNDLEVVYSYWLNEEAPDADFISGFPITVWTCEWAFPSLNADDRDILSGYLTNGGKLFLSGQDVSWDLESSDGNEYINSSGASRDWLENYMKVQFLTDDGGASPIVTAGSNSFFDLPVFDFKVPNRGLEYQYPDEIAPLNGAYSLLDYRNGQSAAVGSDIPYSTVFFGFGGIEAITDYEVRKTAMMQIIDHFADLDITFTEYQNTELTGPFQVDVNVQGNISFEITELWYRYNQEPWQPVTMNDAGNGLYMAELPAVMGETDIEYFHFFKTTDGLYKPKKVHKFHVGVDTKAPVAKSYYFNELTVDRSGLYPVAFEIEDFYRVDTTNVKIYYGIAGGYQDSAYLKYESGKVWQGELSFPEILNFGSVINYHITFNDLAKQINYGRYPETGELSLTISDSALVEDFEEGTNRWLYNKKYWTWIPDSVRAHWGLGSIVSGNGTDYLANLDAPLELRYPIDLRNQTSATFEFWATMKFETKNDSAYFDVREGDGDWIPMLGLTSKSIGWTKYTVDLTPWCGTEHEPVALRFRLKTDDVIDGVNKWGIKFDDISIGTSTSAASLTDKVHLPDKFKLLSAYPNPFNTAVNIPYSIPEMGELVVRIYDVLGREVYSKDIQHSLPGYYNLQWNGKSNSGLILTSGVYLINMQFGKKSESSKIMFLK